VNAYDFSPDGQALAVATAARVAVIDTASGRTQTIVTHSIGKVALVRLGPAGRIAVIEGSTGSLQTWDVRAHRVLATQHQQPPDYLALSPDGHALATLTDNGTLILKDPLTLRSRITLDTRIDTQFRPAEHAAFSSDGRTLAARAIDGAIHLWDTGTGRTRTVLPTPADETTTLAFGPGDTLAVTTPEGALQVWDTGTNRIRASLPGIDAVISSPAFTPGGHALVTDGRYGTALWDLALPTPDQAVHRVCRALGRDFTPQERVQYLPDQPTIHACA
jgi:WD40 repeat protein